ncbi:MAG: tetraacyldisaccharide 4'-kinase [Verrucomicrobiota bacterium]|nr:tetraacyldisaccharide 4'-kinase [Verrucomicrobiota bacterium]
MSRLRRWKRRMQVRLDALERFTVDLIYDRTPDSLAADIVGGGLLGLSWLFNGIVLARQWLYKQRILQNHHLGCLVIVVGNLTVGGTGKTPVVEKLARSLNERGRKVAILSRGYKSRSESMTAKWWRLLTHRDAPPPKIVSDGKTVFLNAEIAGDEPFMLARNLPGVVVLVDKDRVKAGIYAIKKFQADTLILDDGFQYFALKDHLQLLMIDKTNPFGNGQLLPRGILREPVSHLKRASYIFFTKSDGVSDPELEAQVREFKPDADIIECTHRPQYLHAVHGSERMPLDSLKGRKIAAFCGIATPESFERFLTGFGATIVASKWFMDHHFYQRDELESFFAQARAAGADWILTTEKDAVRIEPSVASALPLFYLRVEIALLRGVKDFDDAVTRICFPHEWRKRDTPSPHPARTMQR